MIKTKVFSVLLALCLLLGPAVFAEDEELFEMDFVEEDSGLYQFGENLAAARAFIIARGKKRRIGEWREEKFIFSGLDPETTSVQAETVTIEKKKRPAIRMNPVSRTLRRLQFSEVPPSATLYLWHKISSPEGLRSPEYAYFNIWLGKHFFKRIRLSTANKDWMQEEFDLGVIAFMNDEIFVTFDLAANSAVPLEFLFAAEIDIK